MALALHVLEECSILGEEQRLLQEESGHEGVIGLLGYKLCLGQAEVPLLSSGDDANRRHNGDREAVSVGKLSLAWLRSGVPWCRGRALPPRAAANVPSNTRSRILD